MKLCIHVRPRDSNDGWVVDRYDGRGAWTMTEGLEHRWSLAEARRQASKLTRLIVNDGFNRPRLTETRCCEHLHYDGRQCGHKVSGDERFCGHHRWIHDRADVAEKSPEVAEKSPPQECSICRGTHGQEVIHACE